MEVSALPSLPGSIETEWPLASAGQTDESPQLPLGNNLLLQGLGEWAKGISCDFSWGATHTLSTTLERFGLMVVLMVLRSTCEESKRVIKGLALSLIIEWE
jgi:hypothetical protein